MCLVGILGVVMSCVHDVSDLIMSCMRGVYHTANAVKFSLLRLATGLIVQSKISLNCNLVFRFRLRDVS